MAGDHTVGDGTKRGNDAPGRAYWTVREVAAHYGVGVSTVWRWDAAGDIPPSIKIGGRRLFKISDHVKDGEVA